MHPAHGPVDPAPAIANHHAAAAVDLAAAVFHAGAGKKLTGFRAAKFNPPPWAPAFLSGIQKNQVMHRSFEQDPCEWPRLNFRQNISFCWNFGSI
jgi:hypothetical protein